MKGKKDQTSEKNKDKDTSWHLMMTPTQLDLSKKALSKQGLKVSAFTGPARALEDPKVNCKDCIMTLSDIGMP